MEVFQQRGLYYKRLKKYTTLNINEANQKAENIV